jgi:hypothetical protein
MVNCLRESFLYSEKRARDILFRAIESILSNAASQGTPLMLSKLTREAANRAQRDAQETDFTFSNWETVSKALINAMLGARVLLSEDSSSVLAGIGAQATPIANLKKDYQDLTEAYLLEFLIRKMGDLSTRDHKALAHALFRQFDPRILIEDLEDRVVVLMATLADRVILQEDGSYAMRSVAVPADLVVTS